jgi:hypothetical protein
MQMLNIQETMESARDALDAAGNAVLELVKLDVNASPRSVAAIAIAAFLHVLNDQGIAFVPDEALADPDATSGKSAPETCATFDKSRLN